MLKSTGDFVMQQRIWRSVVVGADEVSNNIRQVLCQPLGLLTSYCCDMVIS